MKRIYVDRILYLYIDKMAFAVFWGIEENSFYIILCNIKYSKAYYIVINLLENLTKKI